jgi:hypothetical protein
VWTQRTALRFQAGQEMTLIVLSERSRMPPNTALQRTRSAPLRSPLSFETLGAAIES